MGDNWPRLKKELARRIRDEREQCGWTRADLDRAIGCEHKQYARRWEEGEVVPSAEHLYRLSVAFDCSIDYLVGAE